MSRQPTLKADGFARSTVLKHALALTVLLVAVPVQAASEGMLLLVRPGWQIEETALMQGLRIYTQDLEIPFKTGALPARAATIDEEVAAAGNACRGDVALVLWFGPDRTMPRLLAFRCASRELRESPLSPPDDLDLATQTLALKVRWLLGKRLAGDAEQWRPVQAVAPPETPKPPPATTPNEVEDEPLPEAVAHAADAPPAERPAPRSNDVAIRRRSESPLSPTQEPNAAAKVELGIAVGADAGARAGWRRGAVTLRALLPFLSGRMAVSLDGSLGTYGTAEVGNRRATVRDYPMGAGLQARLHHGRWTLALGPRVSLHLLSADGGSSDGRAGSQLTTSWGLGGLGEMRLRVWGPVMAGLLLTTEYLAPRRQFTLDGEKAFDFGAFRWSAGIQVVLAFR
jgi:hypothetical protein